ncbi:unnamed protein product [Allacma fusca]|uniref:Uncharacterized protein n=1 Tax=Allacma fusca TaxID=39272 RepID=A0A8J2LB55_9HEXA|nr:unnamed protein product [Allacma fusca]
MVHGFLPCSSRDEISAEPAILTIDIKTCLLPQSNFGCFFFPFSHRGVSRYLSEKEFIIKDRSKIWNRLMQRITCVKFCGAIVRKGHWSRKVLILPCFGEDQPFISDIHPVTLVS